NARFADAGRDGIADVAALRKLYLGRLADGAAQGASNNNLIAWKFHFTTGYLERSRSRSARPSVRFSTWGFIDCHAISRSKNRAVRFVPVAKRKFRGAKIFRSSAGSCFAAVAPIAARASP